jgi:hypothetical protein
MSTQLNKIENLQKEAHYHLLTTKAMVLEAQVRIVKMKASALKARMQTLKNLAIIGNLELQTNQD